MIIMRIGLVMMDKRSDSGCQICGLIERSMEKLNRL